MHLASRKRVRYGGATVIVLQFWTYPIGSDTRSIGRLTQRSTAAPAVVQFRSACPCCVSGAAFLAPISGLWPRCCSGTAVGESLVITSFPLGKRDWTCRACEDSWIPRAICIMLLPPLLGGRRRYVSTAISSCASPEELKGITSAGCKGQDSPNPSSPLFGRLYCSSCDAPFCAGSTKISHGIVYISLMPSRLWSLILDRNFDPCFIRFIAIQNKQ